MTSPLSRALAWLETFLERERPGFADDRALHAEARALSVAYTEGHPIDPHAAASTAYLAHFGPRAVVAVSHALAHADVRGAVVVDAGAGSGAGALAALVAGAKRVHLVDASARSLDVARRLLQGVADAGAVTGDARALDQAAPCEDARLLLSSFTFGELDAPPEEAFRMLARLAPQAGTAVLVDAGDRLRARRVQELRDVLVQEGDDIVFPCPHRDPCPALLRARDWCHQRLHKQLPDGLARFARGVGRGDEEMAASILVVSRGAVGAASADGIVVTGDAFAEKGRARVPVCGPRGLRFVQAMKRHRAAHDAVLALPRGAALPGGLAAQARGETAHVEDEASLVLASSS